MFKKKYDNKEIKCSKCNQIVKPILQKNKLIFRLFSYILVLNTYNILHICEIDGCLCI